MARQRIKEEEEVSDGHDDGEAIADVRAEMHKLELRFK